LFDGKQGDAQFDAFMGMSGRGRLGLAAVVTPVLTPVLCAAGMRCDID